MTRSSVRFTFFLAIFALIFPLQGCSCGSGKKTYAIAVDPEWIPLNFYGQQQHVNGFIEELLIEISGYSGLRFEKMATNWDSLIGGLGTKSYDAAISSLPRYNFNTAKYDFSKNFLDLGPVLVVSAASERSALGEMSNELVGVLAGDQAILILQKFPEVIMRNYPSVLEALDALVSGEVEGVLLDRLLATNYVRDLYGGSLKIAGSPLNDAGLHLVIAKGVSPQLLQLFNRSLDHLVKKKKLQQLMKKWQLD